MSDRRDDKNATTQLFKTNDEWRHQLTPEEYRVTREKGTERAFTGAYHATKEPGVYSCTCCGEDLFESQTKFDSGTGWPSFYAPAKEEPGSVFLTSCGLRTMIGLNVVFGLYNLLDVPVLWLGADLPEGVLPAAYARSGAAWLTIALGLVSVTVGLVSSSKGLAESRLFRLLAVALLLQAGLTGVGVIGAISFGAAAGVAIAADGLMSDIHANAAYRANLVGVMAKRAVAAAG